MNAREEAVRVDLNCDLGESFGAYTLGDDRGVMGCITSANIACGAHAGDPSVMRSTVRLTLSAGVAAGAHPGFSDRAGFGRREIAMPAGEVEDLVLVQIGALAAVARAEGGRLRHVKAHGALYNMAARNRELADAIARATASVDPGLIFFGLSGSALIDAGRAAGLRVASEVFADRAYTAAGSLAPRAEPGSVIDDPDRVLDRALEMVRGGTVTAVTGERLALDADTICVHGDTPGAAALAGRLRAGLEAAGVDVRPVGAGQESAR